jgi:Carboxypeptidase regulatory-like domain
MHPSRARCVLALWLAVFGLLAVFTTEAVGQGTGGRILGRVVDPTGAALANVKVTLSNEATGVPRDTQSNSTGDYVFPQVPVGTYRLEFDLSGFKKNVQRGISLDLNQVLTVNMTMQLGQTKEVVEVTSAAPLVDTTTTQLGAVVDDRSVSGLPLNARDTYQLLQLQPGVQGTGGADLFYGSSQSGAVSVNGGRGRANNFSVNGGDANDLFVNAPAIQPSPDSIQEFRVITNTFDAEYGRNSGAVVNVVTKSGTNELHGDVYEFFRNKALNSKGYLDPFKPDNKTNQFGGTLGGPIRKDKTFFFTSYEGRRAVTGFTSDPVVVPDQNQLKGDFSASPFDPTATLTSQPLADILNGRPGCLTSPASAGTLWLTIFPNSQINPACFDPVAVNLLRFVPPPNNPNNVFSSIGNVHQSVPNGNEQDDQFTVRLDHHLNDAQTLNIYYYLLDARQAQPFTRFEALTPNLLEGFGNISKTRSQQANISHAWALSNTAVNEFRFTYFRNAQGTFLHPQRTNNVIDSCTGSAAAFCFNGNFDVPGVFTPNPKLGITPGLGPNHEGVPFISLSSNFTIGNDYEGELPQIGNTFQWSDNLTKVKGTHSLKFGVDLRRARFDQTLFFDPNGYYSYFGGGPNDLIATNVDGTQNLFPNYLLGLPDSYLQGSTNSEAIRSTSVYLFAQDSWKMRRNLTLNYGLRWELNTPLADKGLKVQTFRPGQSSAIYPCQLSPASIASFQSLGVTNPDCNNTGTAPVGLVVPGDKGIPAGLTETYYKAFAPRIGLAYSPGSSGKSSIRMGYGVFYNPIEQLVLEQFQGEPPFGGSSTITEGFFTVPFATQNCTEPCQVGGSGVAPNPFGGILNPPRGQPVDWSRFRPILLFGELQPKVRPQYAEQYNLTIQRQLGQDLVFQVGYVGSQGHRLLATRDLNFGNPQTCLDLQAMSDIYADSSLTCGPFFADSPFFIPATEGGAPTLAPPGGLHIPYGPNGPTVIPAGQPISSVLQPGASGINLVGLRRYSSPLCNPFAADLSNNGCPQDGVEVFAEIFTQNTIAASNYNSLQVSLEKRASKGLQFLLAYTYSKSIDSASTFEEIQNPLNDRANRSLSLFDARHRFVISYVWDLPVPKFSGARSKVLNGWQVSGITTFQSGFPIRILSNDDAELMNSFDFNLPGKPDLIAPFKVLNPKKNGGFYFDTSAFADPVQSSTSTPLQLLGNAGRAMCCGPGINSFDIALHKQTPITERVSTEFRVEFFNAFNHPQFQNPDGNFSDGAYFGRVLHTRDPRQIQLALKLFF